MAIFRIERNKNYTVMSNYHLRNKLIRPYMPRHNEKVEHSRHKSSEEFYASHRFYSFKDFSKQLAVRERTYDNFPMRPLNWCSPKQALSAFPNV